MIPPQIATKKIYPCLCTSLTVVLGKWWFLAADVIYWKQTVYAVSDGVGETNRGCFRRKMGVLPHLTGEMTQGNPGFGRKEPAFNADHVIGSSKVMGPSFQFHRSGDPMAR
jgi:hypothetical protein